MTRPVTLLVALVFVWGAPAVVAAEAPGAPTVDPVARAYALYGVGQAAYRRGDHAAFLAATRQALALLPDEPTLLVDEARGAALAGRPDETLRLLSRLAVLGLEVDTAGGDFAALRGRPDFAEAVTRLAAATAPLGTSAVAFRLEEKDLLTEGIAHDPTTGTFYISSVHRRKIVAVDRRGGTRDLVAPRQDGLFGVLGIGVDPAARRLWAASSAMPQMDGYTPADKGHAELLCFDLDSGRLRGRWSPPDPSAAHNVNDLVVAPTGEVYVSDSRTGALYRARAEAAALEVLVPPGRLSSPNGLVWLSGGRQLLVADYARGLALVDTATGSVTPLAGPADVLLGGIDGLVRVGETVVAIQNGIRPHRLLALRLDAGAERVTEARLLVRAHPEFDEPTLGVAVGSDLFYIANSQWGAFDGEGRLISAERLRPPTILRLRID